MKEVYVFGLHWGSHSVAPYYVCTDFYVVRCRGVRL